MKKVRYLVFLTCLLIPYSASFAQTPFLKPHLLFKGKEEYNINVIYQEPKGWIWFGTDHGLFRFDGITYSRFTTAEGLASDQITALMSNSDGKLWIGHKNGSITVFEKQSFQPFSPEEGLGKIEITDIAIDSTGVVWYSTNGEGVFCYNGRFMSNFNVDDGISDNYVYDIEIDNKGIMWFATDNGLTRFTNGTCTVISMKDGLNDNIVRVLKSSKDGRIWIGTEDKGITIYDPSDKTFTSIAGWNFGPITGFTMSLEDDIWISTKEEGIIQLKLNGNSNPLYRSITVSHGLISNKINTIIKDQEENIWIGGKQGIIQALPPVFEFLNKSNGTPFEMVYSLAKDNSDNLWVCSESGLYRGIADNTGQFSWTNISELLKLGKTNFISLYLDKTGKIWVGTYGEGVLNIDPETLRLKKYNDKQGLSDNNVISISGNNDYVWFSTLGGGVSCFNTSKSEFINFHDPELRDSYIYSTKSDDKGRTWIAGSLKHPTYIYNDSLFRVNEKGPRTPQLYSAVTDTAGNVWFNTSDKGIIKIEGDSIKSFGPEDGIEYEKIQSITFDKLNNLVVISNDGMLFYKPGSGVILEFGENSGLSYQYPILNSIFTDKEGQIWIGTETGIIKYNPEYLQFIGQNPRVFLSVKNLFTNPVEEGKKKFRYRENNFTFGYTGIWFTNPEELKYRYMLEGFDLKWTYSNRNQNLTYSKLPEGEYSFRAEVSLDNKNWYTYDDSVFTFKVRTPFWKTLWFLSLVIISAISGVYYYIRRRLYNLEKAKEQLEKEVEKRTEEIRNKNKELEVQKKEIASQRDIAEEQRDQIEAQKEEIQSSIRYAHRIQTAVLPPKKQVDSILKDYFILNKPRDIVSGDFYWVAQNSKHLFFSVGDCTGHGVPGSFMSMLGISALNDIVKSLQICKASGVLNLLRERIQESLHQGDERELITYDGMDISLCILDPATKIIQFAAAHNSLYLIRNGEIKIFPADKIDIGRYSMEKSEFTNHTIQCENGDQIYLFTDGYADQFGGALKKKYKSQRLRDFLVAIHRETMEKQRSLLDEEIETWRGTLPQVDDILIMGIRISI